MNAVKRATAGTVLGGATVLAYLFLGIGSASADTHVCIGGYADPTSQGLVNAKAEQGYPCDVPIQWPASIGLPGEPVNVQGSLDVAVPAAVDAYYRGGGVNGASVTIEGWSLGSIAAAQSGDAIRIQNGGVIPPNLTVVTNGNPYGDSGIANDPGLAGLAFDVGAPIVGTPQDVPQMGINRNGVNDAWGNSANQSPVTQIVQIATVGSNHVIPDPAAPHDTYVTHDSVTGADVQNEIYGVTVFGVNNPAEKSAVPGTS